MSHEWNFVIPQGELSVHLRSNVASVSKRKHKVSIWVLLTLTDAISDKGKGQRVSG